LGVLVVVGGILGVAGVVVFNETLHFFSSTPFCLSCHELQENIGDEYMTTVHAENGRGFFVDCHECHIPQAFVPMLIRKAESVRELYHHFITHKIDTPARFESHRMEMASRVWAEMIENDSQDCRRCHHVDLWNPAEQSEKARNLHGVALENGKTCISCHKGIAHKLPEGILPRAAVPEVHDPGHQEVDSR
jgi:nitrate/TMAO reductase-like tetraheme cytochrome c subunit